MGLLKFNFMLNDPKRVICHKTTNLQRSKTPSNESSKPSELWVMWSILFCHYSQVHSDLK